MGKRPSIDNLPLAPQGGEFRQSVWKILREIPYGSLTTYGEIAREIARQNGLVVPRVGLIAAAKDNADVQALVFGRETMEAAEADARYTIESMSAILRGDEPGACMHCRWCVGQKIITEFEEV